VVYFDMEIERVAVILIRTISTFYKPEKEPENSWGMLYGSPVTVAERSEA
jgi:hypothetical protein